MFITVDVTHLINVFFKICDKWRNIILLFIELWWKIVGFFFDNLGILWEAECLWIDINQLFMFFWKIFIWISQTWLGF